ncbi:MAG: helix-turn-helix domain-containing protein [Ramlibacter sp.]
MFRFEIQHITEMHPEQIKAAIRMKGSSPAALADSMSRSRMLVSNVIHGRTVSRPVAEKIAGFIGSQPHLLWPGKYQRLARIAR